jgi:ABA4-like protein
MSLDLIFSTANFLAIAGWIMLAVLPGRAWVTQSVVAGLIPALLSVAYAGLIAAFWSGAEGGFSSLDDVARLFQTPGLLLAGWLHYLAFDLFVGAWEVRTARAEGIPHLLVIPVLALTFLFGPAGFLLFMVIRAVVRAARVQEA